MQKYSKILEKRLASNQRSIAIEYIQLILPAVKQTEVRLTVKGKTFA